jgi:Zn-finger nucleic acid-binding protein
MTEIGVVCPYCHKSTIVSFVVLSNDDISLDADECPHCEFVWLEDVKEQIREDIEYENGYDEEIENLRQEEYDSQVNGRIFEYFES